MVIWAVYLGAELSLRRSRSRPVPPLVIPPLLCAVSQSVPYITNFSFDCTFSLKQDSDSSPSESKGASLIKRDRAIKSKKGVRDVEAFLIQINVWVRSHIVHLSHNFTWESGFYCKHPPDITLSICVFPGDSFTTSIYARGLECVIHPELLEWNYLGNLLGGCWFIVLILMDRQLCETMRAIESIEITTVHSCNYCSY